MSARLLEELLEDVLPEEEAGVKESIAAEILM
jgi:hypothetical protein